MTVTNGRRDRDQRTGERGGDGTRREPNVCCGEGQGKKIEDGMEWNANIGKRNFLLPQTIGTERVGRNRGSQVIDRSTLILVPFDSIFQCD